jgi:hypothetical protein
MDYSHLFGRAWKLVWRHKFLWLPGGWLGLGGITTGLVRLLLAVALPQGWLEINHWLSQPDSLMALSGLNIGQAGPIIWLVIAFFGLTIVVWLLMTIGEGALISAVHLLADGKRMTLRQALSAGYNLLGRYVAIDTILFFPWFSLALFIMIVATLFLFGAVLLSLANNAAESLLSLLGVTLACLLPLLCLLWPVGFLTALFRTLAFRDAVMGHGGVRAIIAHTWGAIRQNKGKVLLLLILIWGIHYVADLLLSLFTIPVVSLTTVPLLLSANSGPSLTPNWPFILLIVLIVGLFITLLQSIVYAYTATVWTLAYKTIISSELQPVTSNQ